MRTALSNHVGEFVLVQGTVDTWFKEEHAIRVCIRNPVIKKGNKNLLFKDQELISKEHHINVFAQADQWTKAAFKRYEPICFCGDVHEYQRADGTSDFGVRSTSTTMLHFRLEHLVKKAYESVGNYHGDQLLKVIDEYFLPKFKEYLEELEEAGDRLPTWVRTYSDYSQELNDGKKIFENFRKSVKGRLLNRDYRRLCKRKNKKWGTIFSREMKQELTLINT